MKRVLVLGFFAFAVVGCGGGGGGDQKAPDTGPQPCSASGSCVKPASMVLRTKSGQETINLSDLTFVQVKVYKNVGPIGGGTVDLRREFTGQDAIKVVTQFGLDTPLENAPQPSTSMTTGQITMNYKRASDQAEQTKTLLIQNKAIILDFDYDDTTYDPKKTFDRAWLEKQPQ